ASNPEDTKGSDVSQRSPRASAVDPDLVRQALEGPPPSFARPDSDVPPGAVRVQLLDVRDRPVHAHRVTLGSLAQGERRSPQEAVTDDEGMAVFQNLDVGSSVAYRVKAAHQGAVFSTNPFRLPSDRGYLVVLRYFETTEDPRRLLQFIGETRIEFVEDRMRVVHFSQLMNPTYLAYVFPKEGMPVALPAGFKNFQAQEVMTDQRMVADDEGFRILGSVPPGRIQMLWGYDLDLSGESMEFVAQIPFRTMMYTVVTEATQGLRLEVEGMPPVNKGEYQGRSVLVSQLQRRPTDPPLTEVKIRVSGIPTAGPLRTIAVAASALLFLMGMFFRSSGSDPGRLAQQAREKRRQELMADAVALEQMHARGEVGPKFHKKRHEEIVVELTGLLRQEQESTVRAAPS
ncbi:MAG: hypothetical protein AAF550_12315, partial [Myxococcota bacterium]